MGEKNYQSISQMAESEWQIAFTMEYLTVKCATLARKLKSCLLEASIEMILNKFTFLVSFSDFQKQSV